MRMRGEVGRRRSWVATSLAGPSNATRQPFSSGEPVDSAILLSSSRIFSLNYSPWDLVV